MGLFIISKELQLEICNYGKPRASPAQQGKNKFFFFFLREEKEAG